MSHIFNLPVEYTMAFGGVETGNMKANEQDIVAGIIRYHGWICVLTAYETEKCILLLTEGS